jgi:SAM-dependent methyltransferase
MKSMQHQGNPGGWGSPSWRDADYWSRAWQQERERSLYGVQQPERSGRGWWDQRAEGFAGMTANAAWRQRQDRIIRLIDRRGYLGPDVEVLDIGCGTGTYALPLAGRVKRVVALDPSSRMLEILQQQAAAEGIANIEPVCAAWEEVDLLKRGWQKRFGLVIASMTPGIYDAETLRRMLEAANHGCYFCGLAWCDDAAQAAVWRRLFRTEIPPIPADIFYVFHLLHAWGYCPSLELQRLDTRWEQDRDSAVEQLAIAMMPYLEITAAVREQIAGVLAEASPDGRFWQDRQFVEGILTWEAVP